MKWEERPEHLPPPASVRAWVSTCEWVWVCVCVCNGVSSSTHATSALNEAREGVRVA